MANEDSISSSMVFAQAAGGDYDALWSAYNEHFKKAVGRRINLVRSVPR